MDETLFGSEDRLLNARRDANVYRFSNVRNAGTGIEERAERLLDAGAGVAHVGEAVDVGVFPALLEAVFRAETIFRAEEAVLHGRRENSTFHP